MAIATRPASARTQPAISMQKWVLQRKNSQGFFVQVATYDRPLSQEEAEKEFGQGYYVLRACKPRFSTAWKGWVGEPKLKNDLSSRQASEIRSLKDTTNNLALGEILLGVGEVAGFALTAANLVDHGMRLVRAEAILQVYNTRNPIGFVCPKCLQPLARLVDSYCGNCGDRLDWTDALRNTEPDTRPCPYCFYPSKPAQHFCTNCGKALLVSSNSTVSFIPVRSWSLP